MSEGRIYDMSFGDSQEQLARTDGSIAAVLCDLSLIRCSVEFAQVRENIWRKGKVFKDALGTILRRDQLVRSGLVELCEFCQLVPAPFRVDQAPHLLQSRYSCPHHEIDRRLAAEERIIVRLRRPAIRQLVRKQDV